MLLAGGGYDLVLTHGLLPDGTGIHIAGEAERQGVRAMIVTAYAFQFPKRDLARYALLLKPVRPDELLEAVHNVLNRSAGTYAAGPCSRRPLNSVANAAASVAMAKWTTNTIPDPVKVWRKVDGSKR